MSPEELLQKIGVRQLPPLPVTSKAERAQADRGSGKARGDELHDRTPGDFEARVGSQPVDQALTPPDGCELKWHGEADDTPLKEWLVDKTLPKRGKALLAGQWGTFKTFVALDLCCSVMTRSQFAGHGVHGQGGVLFIAAEGQDEVRVRLEGIASEKVAKATPEDTRNEAKPVDPTRMPFAWAEACPRLTADDALVKLHAMISAAARGMRERFGLPLALIVIDTLMPAAGFKDANDASENQRVMDVLTNVVMEADALVLAVDHFGKDVTTGTRNSSVKEAAVDTVLALLADRDLAGNVSNPRLAIRKVRGAPTGQEIPFQTRTVTVRENAGYGAITTLVVDWPEQPSCRPRRKNAGRRRSSFSRRRSTMRSRRRARRFTHSLMGPKFSPSSGKRCGASS